MSTKSKKEVDNYNYKGWLISDSLIKRSFAVLGHHIIATLIIYGIFIGIVIILAIVFGTIGAIIAVAST